MTFDFQLQMGRYVRQVIGIHPVFVQSSHQPRCRQATKIPPNPPCIWLPLEVEALSRFLSPDYVVRASRAQCLSVVTAMAYHESAHLKSGEPAVVSLLTSTPVPTMADCWWSADMEEEPTTGKKVPGLFPNLINDVNDFTVCPDRWPRSSVLMMVLARVMFWHGQPIEPRTCAELKAVTDPKMRARSEFLRLHNAYLWYMRSRKIRYGEKITRELSLKDPMAEPFTRCRTIATEARRTRDVTLRAPLIGQLYHVFLAYWIACGGKPEDFDETCNEVHGMSVADRLPGTDPEKVTTEQGDPGKDPALKDELDRAETGEMDPPRGCGGSHGHAATANSDKAFEILPPEVDGPTVRRLSEALGRKLVFRRASKTSRAATEGRTLSLRRLPELLTREHPRLWSSPSMPTSRHAECHLVGVFDRSGSMSGEKEKLCRMAACTLYVALEYLPKIEVAYFGFGSPAFPISMRRGYAYDRVSGTDTAMSRDEMVRHITTHLAASGNNDVPDGLHQALDLLETSRARRKLVLIVNDGDLGGRYDLVEEIARAHHADVDVVMVGIGTDRETMVDVLGEQNSFVITDVAELPDVVSHIALSRL